MTAVCLPPRSGAGIEDYQRSVFEQQPSVPTSWPLITNRVGGAQEKEFTSNSRGPPILNKSSVTLKIYGLRQLATFDRSFADTASATPRSSATTANTGTMQESPTTHIAIDCRRTGRAQLPTLDSAGASQLPRCGLRTWRHTSALTHLSRTVTQKQRSGKLSGRTLSMKTTLIARTRGELIGQWLASGSRARRRARLAERGAACG
jgi:hypothetical protein